MSDISENDEDSSSEYVSPNSSNSDSVSSHTEQLKGLQFLEQYQDYCIQYQIIQVSESVDEDSDIDKILYDYETPSINHIEEQEKEKKQKLAVLDEERQKLIQEYVEETSEVPDSIFNLEGIKFNKFTHKYISFSFLPSVLSGKFVKKSLKFRISLVYKQHGWRLKRMKAPCKDELMSIFHLKTIEDSDLPTVIDKIYSTLVTASEHYIDVKRITYERFRAGEKVELFSEDEELFLTSEELKVRKEKKRAILKRMLPPKTLRRRIINLI